MPSLHSVPLKDKKLEVIRKAHCLGEEIEKSDFKPNIFLYFLFPSKIRLPFCDFKWKFQLSWVMESQDISTGGDCKLKPTSYFSHEETEAFSRTGTCSRLSRYTAEPGLDDFLSTFPTPPSQMALLCLKAPQSFCTLLLVVSAHHTHNPHPSRPPPPSTWTEFAPGRQSSG